MLKSTLACLLNWPPPQLATNGTVHLRKVVNSVYHLAPMSVWPKLSYKDWNSFYLEISLFLIKLKNISNANGNGFSLKEAVKSLWKGFEWMGLNEMGKSKWKGRVVCFQRKTQKKQRELASPFISSKKESFWIRSASQNQLRGVLKRMKEMGWLATHLGWNRPSWGSLVSLSPKKPSFDSWK